MKLILTGASGFVARQIIPFLQERGITPILISSQAESLRNQFPDMVCDTYEAFHEHLMAADGVLHLAAKNNNSPGTLDEFRAVNVEQTLTLYDQARAARVRHFIFASSIHALSLSGYSSDYARSKAEAQLAITQQRDAYTKVTVLYLPTVYGSAFSGKLQPLGRLPLLLQKTAVQALGALKPVVHVSRIAEEVACILSDQADDVPRQLNDTTRNPVYHGVKRAIDLGFAFAAIGLAGWLMVLVWIAIRLDSPGPGVFSQVRVGKDGKTFTCFKFRTMQHGTREAGTHELTSASVTRLGRFLRKTKFDELPQIVNILRNEISLIGPRPCLPSQDELILARQRMGVFAAKPGISGLAQVHDIDMSLPQKLAETDAMYIAQQSILFDLKILKMTLAGAGRGDKVRA